MKSAIYTGSFDPLTKGHIDIIERAAAVFSNVYVGVGLNHNKKYLFTKEERMNFVMKAVWHLKNVHVIEIPDNRLAADIAYELNAVIIKGVRMTADFDYERMIHDISHGHQHGVDTHILPASPTLSHISSSAAKEVCKLNGNTDDFVPLYVKAQMEKRLVNQVRAGITGTIGAGKSTISKKLVEMYTADEQQIHDIDIDKIASDMVYNRQEPVYVQLRENIKELLGLKEIIHGSIGPIIFNQKDKLVAYNKLLIQPLTTRIRAEIQGKEGVLLFNFALLSEGNLLSLVNNNVALLRVDSTEQIRRLVQRGYTTEQIERRLDSQYTYQKKESEVLSAIHREKYGMLITPDDKDISDIAISIRNHIDTI